MQTGTKISAAGHGIVLALALFGLPWFGPRERAPIPVTTVSFVTEADFAAAQSAPAEAPRKPDAPAVQPPPRPAAPPPQAKPEPSDVAPEVPEAVASAAPPAPAPQATTPRVVTAPPSTSTPPQARPVARIKPEPSPAPPLELKPAPEPTPAPTPSPAPVAKPKEAPAAPPEAAPETAAEESPETPLALETSSRPVPRKNNTAPTPAPASQAEAVMAAVQQAEKKPAPPPVPAKPKPTPKPADTTGATPATSATAPSVTQPARPSAEPATSLPVGPPMTGSEKEGLKLAVQRCWNVPAGVRDAQELKVTLAADLAADGSVISSSIRLIEPSTIPDARFKAAYDAGRRALIRCSPYDLPREKFAQWRSIEVVFNPEGMVSW